jgi:hypothetical protein
MPSIVYSEFHKKINDNGIVNQYDKEEFENDKIIQGLVNINGDKYKYVVPKSRREKHVSFTNPRINVSSFYRTSTPYPNQKSANQKSANQKSANKKSAKHRVKKTSTKKHKKKHRITK